ncbi:MAG: T9SS type A sorting domain-containing protein [Cyclobacteriaceae bacterium]
MNISIKTIALLLISTVWSHLAASQSTSNSDGVWTDGSANIWNQAVSTNWTTVNVGHVITRASGWDVKGTFNVNSGGDLTINGDMTVTGGSTLTISGTLRITGTVTLNSNLIINPGGQLIIDTDINVVNSNYLNVGTGVASPPHADMIVKGDLNSVSSGDIIVNQNGRLAVYGDVTSSTSGGSFISLNDGGQMYIGGDLIFPGGSDAVVNNNTGGGIGLYIDGTVSVSGDGSSIGGSEAIGGYASSSYLLSTEGGGDEDFYDFLETSEDSPLPVELLSFNVAKSGKDVLITWVTGSEIDNEFFTVEKSINGKDFSAIAHIDGHGTTSDINSYSLVDINKNGELTYYRLSQTDYDKKTEILGLKVLSHAGLKKEVSFYPNPVPYLKVITFDEVVPERVTVFNQTGQLVFDQKVTQFQLRLPANLESGVYLLNAYFGDNFFSKRLIIK